MDLDLDDADSSDASIVVENVIGSVGNDTVTGNTRPNLLQGGAGNDTLTGGTGDDSLEGGLGDDSLVGNAGDDVFVFTRYAEEQLGTDTIDEDTGSNDAADALDFTLFAAAVDVDLSDTTNGQAVNADLALFIKAATSVENVIGSAFRDAITGNSRNNDLDGAGGNDTVTGGTGDDTLRGGDALDSLVGGDGADSLLGGNEDDTLVGGDGNDTLSGEAGDDRLEGGAGNDSLAGDAGDDTYVFTRQLTTDDLGDDVVKEGSSSNDAGDTLDFSGFLEAITIDLSTTTSQDVGGASGTKLDLDIDDADSSDASIVLEGVIGSAGADTIIGNTEDNILEGGLGDDTLTGSTGDDTYVFTRQLTSDDLGDDVIREGTSSNDTGDTLDFSGFLEPITINLATTMSQDVGGTKLDLLIEDVDSLDASIVLEGVIGSVGDDTITGNTRRNNFTGGIGDDTIDGGLDSGSAGDTFFFPRVGNENLGTDMIVATVGDSPGFLEFANFGAGITVDLTTDGMTAQIVSPGGLSLILQTVNASDPREFRDVYGTASADKITGNSRANLVRGRRGNDTLIGGDGDDTLLGAEGRDSIVGGDGNDSLTGDNGRDTLVGGDGDDTLAGGSHADLLQGGAGDDDIDGGAFNDTLEGGTGNDTLAGGAEKDAYVFSRTGSEDLGEDTLTDLIDDTMAGTINDSRDVLDFSGFGLAILSLDLSSTSQQPIDTTLSGTSKLDITLNDANAFEGVIGSDFADSITGNSRDNILEGGLGNDTLTGGAGDDTFVFSGTVDLGTDTLNEETGTNNLWDMLDFLSFGQSVSVDLGITSSQTVSSGKLSLSLNDASAFEVVLGSTANDTITGNDRNNVLQGSSGNDTLVGESGADSLFGGSGADSLVGGAGNDTLKGGSEADTLVGGAGNDTLEGDAGDDTLDGGDGNDSLQGDAGADSLVGGNGADSLVGGDGNDTLTGDTGNDTLAGGAGDDVYSFARTGSEDLGDDALTEDTTSNDAADTLDFSSFGGIVTVDLGNLDQVVLATKLELTFNSDVAFEGVIGSTLADTITGNARDNVLDGGAGADSISGAAGADSLIGGTGDDILTGGTGDDTFIFARTGSEDLGDDTLNEETMSNDALDTLDFTSIGAAVNVDLSDTSQPLVVDESGEKLQLTLNSDVAFEGVIGSTLADTIDGNARPNVLDGGTGADSISGAAGADSLIGGTGNDTLNGGAGDDSLVGGTGADSLDGGADDDTLLGELGDDALGGGTGDDVYRFDRPLGTEDLGTDTVTESTVSNDVGDTLDFSVFSAAVNADISSALTVLASGKLTLIVTNGDSVPSSAGVEHVIGTTLADTITGNARDNLLQGGAGNDTVSGDAGSDSLQGDAGNDFLSGGSGTDSLVGGDGIDSLFGGDGDDTLQGNDGDDLLFGDGGDDSLAGGLGQDLYGFARATDTDLLGHDTVDESETAGSNDAEDGLFFSSFLESVDVDLGDESLQTIAGGDLTLTINNGESIERAFGSTLADTLTGNARDNLFRGGGGNDSLVGGDGDDEYLYSRALGTDVLGDDTINESSLNPGETLGDRIVFYGFLDAVTIDLSDTSIQAIDPDVDLNLTLISGASIENVAGSSLNDSITGNGLDNYLVGLGGDDTIVGQDGDDRLEGWEGDDSLTGGAGDDQYAFDRTTNLIGVTADDLGADVITEDTVSNDSGDTLDFLLIGGPIIVDLASTSQQTVFTDITVDKLKLTLNSDVSFEQVFGSPLDDTIDGNSRDNLLFGAAGDDVIKGVTGDDTIVGDAGADNLKGGLGNDLIVGGTGDDTYVFARTGTENLGVDTLVEDIDDTMAGTVNDSRDTLDFSDFDTGAGDEVQIDLSSASAQAMSNAKLTIQLTSGTAFEGVIGSALDDTISGNARDNFLEGGEGNDSLTGAAGDDTYIFARTGTENLGDDALIEETTINNAADILDFSSFGGIVTVDLGDVDQVVLTSKLELTFNSAVAFEGVIGSALADTITGNSRNNLIDGEGGDDSITGGDGRDLLIGGTGADTLHGDGGQDLLVAADVAFANVDDLTALRSIELEWASTRLYRDRILSISGFGDSGRLNGSNYLRGAFEVTNDTVVDELLGGTGSDYFFYDFLQTDGNHPSEVMDWEVAFDPISGKLDFQEEEVNVSTYDNNVWSPNVNGSPALIDMPNSNDWIRFTNNLDSSSVSNGNFEQSVVAGSDVLVSDYLNAGILNNQIIAGRQFYLDNLRRLDQSPEGAGLVYGTYHSSIDATSAGVETLNNQITYVRRALPDSWFTKDHFLTLDDYLASGAPEKNFPLDRNQVDYRDPAARDLLLRGIAYDTVRTGAPLIWLDNGFHQSTGFPISWDIVTDYLSELAASVHARGLRVNVNLAYSMAGISTVSDTETDEFDLLLSPSGPGREAVDGLTFEQPFHPTVVRPFVDDIANSFAVYQKLLDATTVDGDPFTVMTINSFDGVGAAKFAETELVAAYELLFRETDDNLFLSSSVFADTPVWAAWTADLGTPTGDAELIVEGDNALGTFFHVYRRTFTLGTIEVIIALEDGVSVLGESIVNIF